MANLKLHDEMTLHVVCDPLTETYPGVTKSLTFKTQTAAYNTSSWTLVLTRDSRTLNIDATWSGVNYYDSNYGGNRIRLPPPFTSMNFVHHKRGIISTAMDTSTFSDRYSTKTIKMSVPVDNAMRGNQYDFEIVFSTQPTLSRTFKMPSAVDSTAEDETDDSAAIKAGPSLAIMKTLLCDRHSVDVQFIFTSDKTCSSIGFWAHRAILSRYKSFGDLIKKSLKEQVAQDGDVGPLTIKMDKFSMASFACLVYFIYTGTIKRTMDTNHFALSQQDEVVVVVKNKSSGRTKNYMQWNPLDYGSSWKLKDVTWTDLLFISEYFGVKELRDECLDEVVESIKESNVIELLFEVGCFFEKVKDEALDFLAENMEYMCDEGKDPFEKYRDHKDCHAMMLDAMRYRSIPSNRRQQALTAKVRALEICG
ncbi:hypothetical protein BGX29_007483 [Mortierella sp. GBA35]|nr:hypothetical protein BGX23_007386 [Mortierella sp. AD031]KAF9098694.1 hypothetical protein BGX29_007483 [Mortierella sp. GBA35]KAG0212431.1 hypothetical protein BGX33_003650 [Mortierella sp. NVP41]